MSATLPTSNTQPLAGILSPGKGMFMRGGRQSPNTPVPARKSVLAERLHHMMVFELSDESGEPGVFREMRLRDLYSYIQKMVAGGEIEGEEGGRGRSVSYGSSPPSGTSHTPLGGYLHPRDMRRMVTPFSSTNLPALIVRRHVIMVNFDPLRAVILRDRVLLLVPDGADGVVLGLEKSVRGGIKQKVEDVFGEVEMEKIRRSALNNNGNATGKPPPPPTTPSSSATNLPDDSEYIQTDMSFELVCLDSVLQAACEVIDKDFRHLSTKVHTTTETLKHSSKISTGEVNKAQELLRQCKNEISVLEGRTEGMERAMVEVLEEDEDLALMNLTKLVTVPEKFIQPVSKTVLEEEGDEPELIIEAYCQQSQSTMNGLKLLRSQVQSTEELVMMQLDRNRNRLLAYNTLLSLLSACLAAASVVGSFFGMNITNGVEQVDGAFTAVVWGTVGGAFFVGILMAYKMSKAGVF